MTRTNFEIQRIICGAQYAYGEDTRVVTRIMMMRRLGRVYTGRRAPKLSIAEEVGYCRQLGIPLRSAVAIAAGGGSLKRKIARMETCVEVG